jgi:hypothetical protein
MLLARLVSTGVPQHLPLSPPRFADGAKIDNALLRSNWAEVSAHLALHRAIAALGCESDGDGAALAGPDPRYLLIGPQLRE